MSYLINTASDDYQQDVFPTSLTLTITSSTQCLLIPTFINDDGPLTFSETFHIVLLAQRVFQVPFPGTAQPAVLPRQLTIPVRILEQCRPGDIRLLGGGLPAQGRVEVCYHGLFTTLCAAGWTLQNTRVVCSQLQLHSGIGNLNEYSIII